MDGKLDLRREDITALRAEDGLLGFGNVVLHVHVVSAKNKIFPGFSRKISGIYIFLIYYFVPRKYFFYNDNDNFGKYYYL